MSGPGGVPPTGTTSTTATEETTRTQRRTESSDTAATGQPAVETPAEPTDSVRAHRRSRHASASGPQLFFPAATLGRPERARLFLDVDARLLSNQPIPDMVDTVGGLGGGQLPGGPTAAQAGAAARIGFDSPHFGIDATVRAGAGARTWGDERSSGVQASLSELQPQIDALQDQFGTIQEELNSPATQQALATIRRVSQEVAGGNLSNLGELTGAVRHVQGVYRRAETAVADLSGRLDRIDQALQGLSDGNFTINMGGSAQGMVSVGAHGRISLPDAGPITRAYVGVRGDAHVPIESPQELRDALPETVTLPQLMARANGQVRLTLQGVESVRETLAAARPFIEAFEAVEPYVDDPWALANDAEAQADAQQAFSELEAKGQDLQTAYDAMTEAFSGSAEIEAEVHRATGPQVGFGAMAGFRLMESESWSGLQFDFAARNLAGFGSGEIDTYGGSLDLMTGESAFALEGTRAASVFHRLFPVTLEGAVSTQLPTSVDADFRTSFMVHGTWQPAEDTGSVMVGASQPLGRYVALQAGYEHLFQPGNDHDMLLGGLRLGDAASGFSWGVMGGGDVDGSAYRAQTNFNYSF